MSVEPAAEDVAVPSSRERDRSRRPRSRRDHLLDVAGRLTTDRGWSAVTMTRLADTAGVARQTVYNEIGTRADLAEAMILRELERFLACVNDAFDAHPDNLLAAIRQATQAVLERAEGNPLLKAVASATHGADTELLPFLTTHSQPLLTAARDLIRVRIAGYDVDLAPLEAEIVIDSVVRVVLSHVMQPSATPSLTAEGVAWIAGRVLRLP